MRSSSGCCQMHDGQCGVEGSLGKALTAQMARRDAVLRAVKDHPVSPFRTCALIDLDSKTVRRERPPDNPQIHEEMHKIAGSAVAAAIGA